MAKKPLVLADDTPVDQRFQAEQYTWEEQDASYIPGYSEIVKANDIATSERLSTEQKERYYQRWSTGPRRLPFEFVYLRMTNAAGGVSHSAAVDRMVYNQAGYTICKKDDFLALKDRFPEILLGTPWDNGSATLEPDGTIRRLDSALFVVMTDNPRYLAWQRRRAEENTRAESGIAAPVGPGGYVTTEDAGQFEGTV